MPTKTFEYTSYAIAILQKIIGSRFSVTGLENLPKNGQPIMFVANHFTRSETFFVPYLIHKYTNRQVRSLADASLYHGFLGRFLTNVGTISTKDPNRDKIIVKDLIQNNYDWLIYPEGSMIKSKQIEKQELYISHTPHRIGATRTGSAVLALKSHLYRQDIIEAYDAKNTQVLEDFKKELDIEYDEYLRQLTTYVVSLSITYYPIRPGENRIEMFAKKRIDQISPRLVEELQIEGNLLSQAQINLHFGEPMNLTEYTKMTRGLIYQIPIIKNDTKTNFIIKYFKNRLTNDFMEKIYSNIEVNIDHIFSASLRHILQDEVDISHLKRIVYLSALMINKSKNYRINDSIQEKNLFKIFSDETHLEFEGIFNLAKKLGEITQIDENTIRINKTALFVVRDFHEIRLQSTLQVIFNEFSLLENAGNIVRRNCHLSVDEVRNKVVNDLIKSDQDEYKKEYKKYFDKDFSKPENIGMPYLLSPKNKTQETGILLCHGYKSSPKEVEALAKFLCDLGFIVYAVRLKGHGTSPINLQDVFWQDWRDSMQKGYAILNNICQEMVIVGFSAGGLLALLSSSKKNRQIKGVVSINAALKLQDMRARFVPAINWWNEVLHKFHIEKGLFEYVDDKPENPDFNYSRNYLKGVEELEKLMKKCEDSLDKVSAPTLIIQALKDPVINPVSAKLIYDKIESPIKHLSELDLSNHVIINGDGKETVFQEIKDFLSKIKAC